MHTKFQKIAQLFLLFVLLTAPASALSAEVVSISITSSHSGFAGFDSKSDLHIHKTAEGYKGKLGMVDLNYNFETLIKEGLFIENKEFPYKQKGWIINTKITTEKEVFHRLKNDYKETSDHFMPSKQIEHFIQALKAPPKTSLDISQFGINQKWLRTVAEDLIDKRLDQTKDYYFLMKSRTQELIGKLSNVKKAIKDISRYYSSLVAYDDYPELKAVITLSNNQTIHLTSSSQHEFMIPWKVKRNGDEHLNYDIQISKSLDKLLPEKFLEKERIQGNLIKVFEDHIWASEIYDFVDTIESEFELRRSNRLRQK